MMNCEQLPLDSGIATPPHTHTCTHMHTDCHLPQHEQILLPPSQRLRCTLILSGKHDARALTLMPVVPKSNHLCSSCPMGASWLCSLYLAQVPGALVHLCPQSRWILWSWRTLGCSGCLAGPSPCSYFSLWVLNHMYLGSQEPGTLVILDMETSETLEGKIVRKGRRG